jgi:hypothetical protein
VFHFTVFHVPKCLIAIKAATELRIMAKLNNINSTSFHKGQFVSHQGHFAPPGIMVGAAGWEQQVDIEPILNKPS